MQSQQDNQPKSIIPQSMGCAQETFESILRCIHRDSVHPCGKYLEDFMNRDSN